MDARQEIINKLNEVIILVNAAFGAEPVEPIHYDTKVPHGFIRPTEGVVTSRFRTKERPRHHGIDIAKQGDVPVVSIFDGKILRSYNHSQGGQTVIIEHFANNLYYVTLYAHLRERLVKDGEAVTKGQQIGWMGNTGVSTGQHLHFEIHRGGWNAARSNAVNPEDYFSWK